MKTARTIVLLFAVLAGGCASKLDDDLVAIHEDYARAMTAFTDFNEFWRGAIGAQMAATFDYIRTTEAARYDELVFRDRTVVDAAGVPRMATADDAGKPQPPPIADVKRYADERSKQVAFIDKKEAQWHELDAKWGQVIAASREATAVSVRTMKDLVEAKKSAQAFALQATEIIGSLTSGLAVGYFAR